MIRGGCVVVDFGLIFFFVFKSTEEEKQTKNGHRIMVVADETKLQNLLQAATYKHIKPPLRTANPAATAIAFI